MRRAIRKAQPTAQDVHINRPLTNISVAFIQSSADFIAGTVFPTIPVAKQSDLYRTYDRADFFRNSAERRAPGTESAGSGFGLGQDNYFAHVYAFHKDVDDDTRANADAGIMVDRDATEFVTQVLLIQREEIWAADYFVTGVWGTELDGVSGAPGAGQFQRWDEAGSVPIEDVTNERTTMKSLTGFLPNTLVVSMEVDTVLKNHADIVDRYKHSQAGVITDELVARVLGVEKYVVAMAVHNTAAEGATEATSFIMGKAALLAYSNPRPSLLTPSAGYTFAWTGRVGGAPLGVQMSRFRIPEIKSDRVEGELSFDTKLVSSELGVFFDTAIN